MEKKVNYIRRSVHGDGLRYYSQEQNKAKASFPIKEPGLYT